MLIGQLDHVVRLLAEKWAALIRRQKLCSGAVAAQEMAVSERRGLSGESPTQCGWGYLSLLVLMLSGCSGRIHRLTLTVSPAGLASLSSPIALPVDGAAAPPTAGLYWSRPGVPPPGARNGLAWLRGRGFISRDP